MKTDIINIRWTGDEYKVSLPDWEGGDVVTVEAHKSVVARQQSRIQELEEVLKEAAGLVTNHESGHHRSYQECFKKIQSLITI